MCKRAGALVAQRSNKTRSRSIDNNPSHRLTRTKYGFDIFQLLVILSYNHDVKMTTLGSGRLKY